MVTVTGAEVAVSVLVEQVMRARYWVVTDWPVVVYVAPVAPAMSVQVVPPLVEACHW